MRDHSREHEIPSPVIYATSSRFVRALYIDEYISIHMCRSTYFIASVTHTIVTKGMKKGTYNIWVIQALYHEIVGYRRKGGLPRSLSESIKPLCTIIFLSNGVCFSFSGGYTISINERRPAFNKFCMCDVEGKY